MDRTDLAIEKKGTPIPFGSPRLVKILGYDDEILSVLVKDNNHPWVWSKVALHRDEQQGIWVGVKLGRTLLPGPTVSGEPLLAWMPVGAIHVVLSPKELAFSWEGGKDSLATRRVLTKSQVTDCFDDDPCAYIADLCLTATLDSVEETLHPWRNNELIDLTQKQVVRQDGKRPQDVANLGYIVEHKTASLYVAFRWYAPENQCCGQFFTQAAAIAWVQDSPYVPDPNMLGLCNHHRFVGRLLFFLGDSPVMGLVANADGQPLSNPCVVIADQNVSVQSFDADAPAITWGENLFFMGICDILNDGMLQKAETWDEALYDAIVSVLKATGGSLHQRLWWLRHKSRWMQPVDAYLQDFPKLVLPFHNDGFQPKKRYFG